MPVVLALLELALAGQPVEDDLVRLRLGQPLEAVGDHAAVEPDHGERLEAVVAADLEVDRVVARRDLEGAGAELGLDPRVRDDRDMAADHRDDDLLADRVGVAGIVGVHGDCDVGEDRRRPDRGDRDRSRAVDEGVPRVGERVVHLDVLDLEVGDGSLVVGAPVDDAVRPVDPSRLPQADEVGHDGVDVAVVHRETLTRVVERAAELAELAHDHPARALEPRPGALEERVPSDLLARGALGDQLLLEHVLGGDPGVVVSRLPERVVAPHPVPADQGVLHRAVEGVAHVELARDVRRRHADDERLGAACAGTGLVEALGFPGFLPAPLDCHAGRSACPSSDRQPSWIPTRPRAFARTQRTPRRRRQ